MGRARVNEELNTVLQRAKDRKLEEMKRYEMQQQLEATKFKKSDSEINDNKVSKKIYIFIYLEFKMNGCKEFIIFANIPEC